MNAQILSQLDPVTEMPGLVWPMTDTLRMEAAMILWEVFLDRPSPSLCRFLEDYGSVEARHHLMPLVEPLHIGWHVHEAATQGGLETFCPFDWEFAPWFLQTCVDYDFLTSGTFTLRGDWLDLCRNARRPN